MTAGVYLVDWKVGALGGAFKDTNVDITVVCSLEMVDYQKEFKIPFKS